MKFTAKMDFKTARGRFESGNTHDSEKLGIPDAKIRDWYNAGWIEVDGWDPSPEAVPGVARKVNPRSAKFTSKEK